MNCSAHGCRGTRDRLCKGGSLHQADLRRRAHENTFGATAEDALSGLLRFLRRADDDPTRRGRQIRQNSLDARSMAAESSAGSMKSSSPLSGHTNSSSCRRPCAFTRKPTPSIDLANSCVRSRATLRRCRRFRHQLPTASATASECRIRAGRERSTSRTVGGGSGKCLVEQIEHRSPGAVV